VLKAPLNSNQPIATLTSLAADSRKNQDDCSMSVVVDSWCQHWLRPTPRMSSGLCGSCKFVTWSLHTLNSKLDGCIVLNKHNTVFASNRSATCNRCFPGPTRVLDVSWSLKPFLPGSLGDRLTDKTDRWRYSVGDNRRSAQWTSQILLLPTTTTSIRAVGSADQVNFSNLQL